MKHDYSEFDKKMLALIAKAPCTALQLCSALREDSASFASKPGEGWRVIDRRLQALRKKGAIDWVRRGRTITWVIAESRAA